VGLTRVPASGCVASELRFRSISLIPGTLRDVQLAGNLGNVSSVLMVPRAGSRDTLDHLLLWAANRPPPGSVQTSRAVRVI
jgi:hypothetical protein